MYIGTDQELSSVEQHTFTSRFITSALDTRTDDLLKLGTEAATCDGGIGVCLRAPRILGGVVVAFDLQR